MKRPAAILFDCDGVLADTELVVNSIVAEEMTLRGWPMTAAEARETFLGMALPDMLPRIEARVGLLPPDWGQEISTLIARRMAEETLAIPGAVEAVRAFAAAARYISGQGLGRGTSS